MFRIVENHNSKCLMLPSKNEKPTKYRELWKGTTMSRIGCIDSFPMDTLSNTYIHEDDIETKLRKEEYMKLSSILLEHELLYDKRRDEMVSR